MLISLLTKCHPEEFILRLANDVRHVMHPSLLDSVQRLLGQEPFLAKVRFNHYSPDSYWVVAEFLKKRCEDLIFWKMNFQQIVHH